jgi:hypothetical protein
MFYFSYLSSVQWHLLIRFFEIKHQFAQLFSSVILSLYNKYNDNKDTL